MKIKSMILLLITTISLTNPSFAANSTKLSSKNLKNILLNLNADIKNPNLTSKICHEKLNVYYDSFSTLTSTSFDKKSLNKNSIKELIKLSFSSRLELKEKLKSLVVKSDDDTQCLTRARDIMRVLRYLEDYLIEHETKISGNLNKNYTTLKGGYPELLTNPNFNFKEINDLKSGDVILSRGNAFTSAAIARIGSIDTQFSHLTFVYEDKVCSSKNLRKCLYTIEAHIEIGSVVAPIKTHIKQGNSRTVVFRMKDSALAHEAAKYMYDKVKNSKKIIQYDFGMDYKKTDRLFCSEVVFDGFYTVSNQSIDIPQNKMKFPTGLIPFLNQMGIKVNKQNINNFETFSPGDIEYDSRFELVAEWRNPLKLTDTRQKDIVLTSMFHWMENLDYRFKIPFFTDIKARAAWTARHLPIVSLLLKEKMPINMTKDQLNLFVTLDQIGSVLQKRIKEEAFRKKHLPFTPKEMFDVLENFRQEDARTYLYKGRKRKVGKHFRKSKTKPKFHNIFRASRKKVIKSLLKK